MFIVYSNFNVLTFAVNYSQFESVHLFENIFIILSNSRVSPHAGCEPNSVHR